MQGTCINTKTRTLPHTPYRSAARGFDIFSVVGGTCTGRMRKSRSRRPRHGFCRSHAVRNAAKEGLSRSKVVRRSLARSKLFTYSEYICGGWIRSHESVGFCWRADTFVWKDSLDSVGIHVGFNWGSLLAPAGEISWIDGSSADSTKKRWIREDILLIHRGRSVMFCQDRHRQDSFAGHFIFPHPYREHFLNSVKYGEYCNINITGPRTRTKP